MTEWWQIAVFAVVYLVSFAVTVWAAVWVADFFTWRG